MRGAGDGPGWDRDWFCGFGDEAGAGLGGIDGDEAGVASTWAARGSVRCAMVLARSAGIPGPARGDDLWPILFQVPVRSDPLMGSPPDTGKGKLSWG